MIDLMPDFTEQTVAETGWMFNLVIECIRFSRLQSWRSCLWHCNRNWQRNSRVGFRNTDMRDDRMLKANTCSWPPHPLLCPEKMKDGKELEMVEKARRLEIEETDAEILVIYIFLAVYFRIPNTGLNQNGTYADEEFHDFKVLNTNLKWILNLQN